MKTMQYRITINAPRENVWRTMLDQKTFRIWTAEFAEGSYFEGSWNQGDRIKFLTPTGEGMSSVIAENRLHEFISIHHVAFIKDGVEDTQSPEFKSWTPAFENYTFIERNGGTEVVVDMNVIPEYEEFMNTAWPKALSRLRVLCETS